MKACTSRPWVLLTVLLFVMQPVFAAGSFSPVQTPDLKAQDAGASKPAEAPALTVSPEVLDFGNQLVNSASSTRILTVTNNTGKAFSNLQVSPAGDFTENHSGCQAVSAGASCALAVVFSPKHAGPAAGALTLSITSADPVVGPRVVALTGTGVLQCNPIRPMWSLGAAIVLVVCGLYFLGMVLVRWNMIARPARLQLRAQTLSVQTRLDAEFAALPPSDEFKKRKDEIELLLRGAIYVIKTKHDPFASKEDPPPPWWTRLSNAIFWTRGHELAGWSLVHEAEEQLVALLPLERVRARMESAEQQLRDMDTPASLKQADLLRDAVQSGDVVLQERLRNLLTQASILQQGNVPAAAQQLLLLNSLQQASDFLKDLNPWLQGSTAQATALDACQTTLTQFQQKFAGWNALQLEVTKLLDRWQTIPRTEQAVLQSFVNFLTGPFATAYQSAGAQPDLNTCNRVLGNLANLKPTAQSITTQIAALVSQGQDVAAFKAFIDLAKPQTDLLTSIEAALVPLKSADLLRQIRDLMDADSSLKQNMNASANAASSTTVSSFRPMLSTFAFSLPLAQDLTAKIKCELDHQLSSVSGRWRSVLMEALSQIYDRGDTTFAQLASWHNKLMWLVVCALLFILALAITFQNPVLLLLGAVGGLLSRLTRTVQEADVENDYGASWGKLFLSPVTGALSAWGGILLIILGNKLNILGSALNLDWCNPYDPMVLGIALLFGFSERLFDEVADQVGKKIAPAPSSPTPTPASPSPTITAIDPLQATAGKENKLSVRGTGFKASGSASFTDAAGKAVAATLEFKDGSNVVVTLTPPGKDSYKSILTITNPDGKTATFAMPVQAGS